MAVQEDKKLRDYELVVIISPGVAKEAVDGIMDGVGRLITDSGGTVSAVEPWGKKRLAYPIKHFLEGSYILTRFKMQPKFSKQLEASLRISEDVLRHLLINLE
ncbi:MAG: 30S ribosomal protein S6 [Deltaproteobacteria bacterium]|nr:30S ribosomal protein S6 [Deltaproteobacteria bacterium]